MQVYKKVTNNTRFFNFPVSSNNFSSQMESWCSVLVENQSLSGKLTFIRCLNRLFLRKTQEISAPRHNFSTNPLHTLHIFKQTTEYLSEIASQQAGEPCFLNNEMPKKFLGCPSVIKSTERGPRVPHYQSVILSTITARIIT